MGKIKSATMGNDKNIIFSYVEQSKQSFTKVDDDKLEDRHKVQRFQDRHTKETLKHIKHYGEIIQTYKDNIYTNLKMKRIFKIVFFTFSIVCLVATWGIFAYVLIHIIRVKGKATPEYVQIITAVLSCLVSTITIYNVIPKTVAKYLFNVQEDQYMIQFLQSTQTLDSSVIQLGNAKVDSAKDE